MPELGESQIHILRRTRLYHMEQNMRMKFLEEETPDIDYENMKINIEGVSTCFAAAKVITSGIFCFVKAKLC